MHNETEADYAYAKGREDERSRCYSVGLPQRNEHRNAAIKELMSEIISVVEHGNKPTAKDPYILKAVEYVRKLCEGEVA